MSKKEKLLSRFFASPPPRDFRWDDLVTILERLGFRLVETSGGSSHKAFENVANPDLVIYAHRPHPSGILLIYQIRQIKAQLQEWGLVQS